MGHWFTLWSLQKEEMAAKVMAMALMWKQQIQERMMQEAKNFVGMVANLSKLSGGDADQKAVHLKRYFVLV